MQYASLVILIGFGAATFASRAEANGPKPVTAADKVKATVSSTKPAADGVQSLIITLDIAKDCHLYANPVKHNNEFLDVNRTTLKFEAKEKVKYEIKYPAGSTKVDGKENYDIYEGVVKIQAKVTRTMGDASPLEIRINLHGTYRDLL